MYVLQQPVQSRSQPCSQDVAGYSRWMLGVFTSGEGHGNFYQKTCPWVMVGGCSQTENCHFHDCHCGSQMWPQGGTEDGSEANVTWLPELLIVLQLSSSYPQLTKNAKIMDSQMLRSRQYIYNLLEQTLLILETWYREATALVSTHIANQHWPYFLFTERERFPNWMSLVPSCL